MDEFKPYGWVVMNCDDLPASPARVILDHAEEDAAKANAIGTYTPYRIVKLFYKEEK